MARALCACLIIAGSAAALAAGAAGGAAPASQPAVAPVAVVHVGDEVPVDQLFALVARRFGLLVVNVKPLAGQVRIAADLPPDLTKAVETLNSMLLPLDGQAVLTPPSGPGGRVVLRIVTPDQARQMALEVGPVSSGIDPKQINVTDGDRMVTHLLPLAHAELLEAVSKAATQDPGVSITVTTLQTGAYQLILTGPALQVRRAVETAIAIDKPPPPPVMRVLTLKNLNAQTGADAMEQSFNRGPPEEWIRAVVDQRTNSVLLTGPEMTVLEAMLTLERMDDPPAALPAPHVEMPLRRLPVPQTRPATQPGARWDGPGTLFNLALDETSPAEENGGLPLIGGNFARMSLSLPLQILDQDAVMATNAGNSSEKGEFFAT